MNGLRSVTAAAALSLALAAPAFAQSTMNNNAGNPNGANPPAAATASSTDTGATHRGSSMMGSMGSSDVYLTGDNNVRASKVIGASVYDDHDQKIGTIDELLMNQSHDVTQAVVSVGGFLGVDSKLVAVNIDKLQVKPDRIVLTGATKDSLTKMPTYTFSKSS